jgi:hypothetical protein
MFATLLTLLSERGINIGSGYPDAAAELLALRGALLVAFFTPSERLATLPALEALRVTASELEAYDCQLNDRRPEGQGEALLAGMEYLRHALASVPDSGAVMLIVH